MNFMISKQRLAILLVASTAVAVLGSTSAFAELHSLTGNARFQIGGGLPIPIGLTPPPAGKIHPKIGGAVIGVKGAGPGPRQLTLKKGNLTWAPSPKNIGVYTNNTAVFQVNTTIGVSFPSADAVLKQSGRTGIATVTVCAGEVPAPGTNPACGAGPYPITGLMIYKRTTNQFGGPAQAKLTGAANVALNPSLIVPPCINCPIAFALANPAATAAQGGPFGFKNSTAPGFVSPGVFIQVAGAPIMLGNGSLTGGLAGTSVVPLGPGPPNTATSYAGPWTTGSLTVSQKPTVGGLTEFFTLMGADARTPGGLGSISLVSASLSNRAVSKANANRGWLNLTIGAAIPGTPSMSAPGIVSLVGLMGLAGGYVIMRRRVGSK